MVFKVKVKKNRFSSDLRPNERLWDELEWQLETKTEMGLLRRTYRCGSQMSSFGHIVYIS